MRSLILVLCFLLPQVGIADCDFKTGITKVESGYLYTKDCHIKVGVIVEENKLKTQKITELQKTIELKDLQVRLTEERVDLWRRTSLDLEKEYNKRLKLNQFQNWVNFTLGVAVTGVAVWGASKLVK